METAYVKDSKKLTALARASPYINAERGPINPFFQCTIQLLYTYMTSR